MINLSKKKGWLDLKVTDDGKGFDEQNTKKGNGLVNMKTRARSLGGQLEVLSKPGEGCTIRLQCPVK